MRLGIIDQSVKGWAAGGSFTKSLLWGFNQALGTRPEIQVVFFEAQTTNMVPKEFQAIKIPSNLRGKAKKAFFKQQNLDVIMPVRDYSVPTEISPSVGWIPDFQHEYLHEFSDNSHRTFMRSLIAHLVKKCNLILLSSRSSKKQFESLFPKQRDKARVASFTSNLWGEPLSENPVHIVEKYNLPKSFGLVANQFWGHKNHKLLPEALSLLKRKGIEANLVLTGIPADFRDPENSTVSELLQLCQKFNVHSQIFILGKTPYFEMVDFMRTADFILQPSRWEGWSTSVEDAKALGKPVLCSNLEVHREQAPQAIGFFDAESPENLADVLQKSIPFQDKGWQPIKEREGLKSYQKHVLEFGESLLKIADEAAKARRPSKINKYLNNICKKIKTGFIKRKK